MTERLHFSLQCIGEGKAPHSSVLAWRIPGTGEPDGLPSMGSHRVGHDWSDLAPAAATIVLTGKINNSSAWEHSCQHGVKGSMWCIDSTALMPCGTIWGSLDFTMSRVSRWHVILKHHLMLLAASLIIKNRVWVNLIVCFCGCGC